MAYKLVVKEQNGHKVLVGFVPEDAVTIQGAELLNVIVATQACPEPPIEVKNLIAEQSNRSFDLHKVVNGTIVCRTVDELKQSTFITWEWNFQRD